ncbi:Uncharacterized protein FKW44_002742, partial [Caligus rogercresseyi]
FRPSLRADLMNLSYQKKLSFQSQQSVQPYDPTNYFFHKYGSSFHQIQAPLTKTCTSHGMFDTCKNKLSFPPENIEPIVNKFKLNVQTNAVCVDILVYVTRDEK